MKEKQIQIDCAPGITRPNTYLEGCLKGTGIDMREPINKFFGEWSWNFNDISDEKWKEVRPVIWKRIKECYNEGWIRFGSISKGDEE